MHVYQSTCFESWMFFKVRVRVDTNNFSSFLGGLLSVSFVRSYRGFVTRILEVRARLALSLGFPRVYWKEICAGKARINTILACERSHIQMIMTQSLGAGRLMEIAGTSDEIARHEAHFCQVVPMES